MACRQDAKDILRTEKRCEPSVKLKINGTHNLHSQQTPLGDNCNELYIYIVLYIQAYRFGFWPPFKPVKFFIRLGHVA